MKINRLLQKLAVAILIKTSDQKLPFYKVDRIVRKHLDKYRLYEWETIERWREQTASLSMQLSDKNDSLKHNNSNEKLAALIQEYRQQLRKEKKYDISDQLRDILKSSGVSEKDNNVL